MKHTPKDYYEPEYLAWELFHRDEALSFEEARLSNIVDAFGSSGDEVAAIIQDLELVTKDAPVFLFQDEGFEHSFDCPDDFSPDFFFYTPELWRA